MGWSLAFVNDRTRPVWWGWFFASQLIEWAFPVIFFVAGSIALSWLLRTDRFARWAFALAAAYSIVRIATETNWFAPEAGWRDYVWVYGEHAMPLVGAMLGVLFVARTGKAAAVSNH